MDALSQTRHLAVRMTAPGGQPVGAPRPPATEAGVSKEDAVLRKRLGEFVGNIFYGTLIRQMNDSSLKGAYLHGGRGEEVFQGQLGMEFATRLGRAPNDPITNKLFEAMRHHSEARSPTAKSQSADHASAPAVDGKQGES
jgi:hypothetical protein